MLRRFWEELNILEQCRRYRVSLWQCPSFLFIVMGIVIIAATLATYIVATRYTDDPLVVAIIVIVLAAFLFVVGNAIVAAFDRVAEASYLKSEFVAVASHQLRAPIAALRWAISFLLRLGPFSAKQSEYLGLLQENTNRMTGLVNTLLDVHRIESGGLALKLEPFNLVEATEKLVKEFEPVAEAHNISLHLFIEPDLGLVRADPERTPLVVQNLLDNAIKYSRGKGAVEVVIRKFSNRMVRWEVRDQGVGIPKQEQKQIFEKFFRARNIMKYETIGTGLGLFIARAIIQASGGEIRFSSEEGKGSVFWFTLPLA